MGATAALCTAFYMFRLVYLTFLGESRVDEHTKKHLHESPKTMTVPLMILAGLSIVGGWIGIPELLGGHTIPNYFHHWLAPAVEKYGKIELHHYSHAMEYGLMALSVAIAIAGFALAHARYHRLKKPLADPTTYTGISKILWNKYWVDEIYAKLIINPLIQLSDKIFLKLMDKGMIDGIADGSANTWQRVARIGSFLQTGNMQQYAFYILIGVAAVIGFVVIF
jgi:NADH-quinone oxidoreductase subunit L